MPRYVAVRSAIHSSRRWRRLQNYHFAAKEAVVPLVGAEIVKAAPSMPIAFVRLGEAFQLVAVLSISSGLDMFVAPDGRWFFGYIPAFLRAYPFQLLPSENGCESVLCVDEDSGLVTDDAQTGEPFFDAAGAISTQLDTVLRFLGEFERSRVVTDLAVSTLAQAGVIVPWSIMIKTAKGEQNVQGLYKIDEAALNALPTESFDKLRATGALPIAYGQLFSMNQLSVFKTLADLQAKMAPKPAAALPDTLDKLFDMGNTDVLRFD